MVLRGRVSDLKQQETLHRKKSEALATEISQASINLIQKTKPGDEVRQELGGIMKKIRDITDTLPKLKKD